MGCYEEKNAQKKEEKEAAGYAKLLVKRGKEVEKNRLSRDMGYPCQKPLSLSTVKNAFESNK